VIVEFKNKSIRLPDVLIPGAAKSGTTSLYQMLSQHPQVYFPPSEKEPFFFCFGNQKPLHLDQPIIDRVTYDEAEYFELYQNAGKEQLLFDGSTAYLYRYEEAIANMKLYYGEKIKEVKVIIVLRNPIERAWSHYNFLIRNGLENLPFEEAIQADIMKSRSQKRWGFDYLGFGKYADQVKAYQDTFPNTKVFLLEDLKKPNALCNEIFNFLGIGPLEIEKAAKANPSGIPKSKVLVNLLRKNQLLKKAVNLLPESIKHKLLAKRDKAMTSLMKKENLNSETRSDLISFYKEDINQLEKIIGRDLSSWKERPE
jgi:hypothetical protein